MESKKRASNVKTSVCLFKWRYRPQYLCLVKKWDAPVPRTLADQVARCLSDCAIGAAQPILAPIPTEVEVKILDSWRKYRVRATKCSLI